MDEPIVSFQDVCKRYQAKVRAGLPRADARSKEAVHHLTFELPAGKVIGFIGPNGSGKTTTLKLMSGLLQPSAGQVLFRSARVRRTMAEHIAYLSDDGALYGSYTVDQMVRYCAGIYTDFNADKAAEMLAFMRLEGGQRIRTLSKGNRGRLKIVLAVSRRAPLIVMDEPLAGLDPLVRESVLKGLISFIDLELQTVVLSTHEVAEVEPLLDMALLLDQGELKAMDSTDHIRETHGENVVQWMKRALT
jgi:ABC-2 type transport system ATP-binding protein